MVPLGHNELKCVRHHVMTSVHHAQLYLFIFPATRNPFCNKWHSRTTPQTAITLHFYVCTVLLGWRTLPHTVVMCSQGDVRSMYGWYGNGSDIYSPSHIGEPSWSRATHREYLGLKLQLLKSSAVTTYIYIFCSYCMKHENMSDSDFTKYTP